MILMSRYENAARSRVLNSLSVLTKSALQVTFNSMDILPVSMIMRNDSMVKIPFGPKVLYFFPQLGLQTYIILSTWHKVADQFKQPQSSL